MKILFFIDVLTSGGKERRLTELMKGLKQIPYFEFELALMSQEISYKEVLDLNIPIHYLIRKTKKDLSIFRMFYGLCKKNKPDIVHCWGSMTAVYSAPICKMLNIKLVNGLITDSPEIRNIFNDNWFRAKLTFPFSDIIVGNSKAGLIAYNAPHKKSFCIHNGFNFKRADNIIDSEFIRKQLNIKTRYIIGMVANYSVNKDYKTFFSAAQIILAKRKDITFMAIGDFTDSELSRRHINKYNIDSFRLLGRQSGIESYVNVMDVCVLSTFTEGISNSILEYMALGKPVVATSGGGTNEIVFDKKTGFLVNKSNPKELAEKINILLNNNNLRAEMGAAGKELIENSFTIDNMVNGYCILYNKIYSKVYIRKMNFLQKILRESFAYMLVQVYFLFKKVPEGILSIYFHNPPKFLFENIVKWLVAKGYSFISIKELDYLIHQKLKNEKLVFISFDDGWKGNLELIELINKYKVPVTIFIITDAVVNGNYWWEYSLLAGQQKYSGVNNIMDFKGLQDITLKEKIGILKNKYYLQRSCITLDDLSKIEGNELITIGSHTVTHPIMTNCTYETQSRELSESKRILTKWLSKEVKYFSYPNGDFDENTVELVKKNGYELGFTTHPGVIDCRNIDPYVIPRNAIFDSGGYFENISKILGIWQKFISSEKERKANSLSDLHKY